MTLSPEPGRVLFPERDRVRVYDRPRRVVTASDPSGVLPALHELREEVASGRHAVGYVAYEAAAAFDSALQTHAGNGMPLLWFGVYDAPRFQPAPSGTPTDAPSLHWRPRVGKATYFEALEKIRTQIAAGNTYQVNYTYPLETAFTVDPEAWFWERVAAQEGGYCAFLDLGRHKIMSLSPELFFALDQNAITTRPMKGTRPRGHSSAADDALAAELRASTKECAENLMIVDMLRNDLGRICRTRSIQVPALFSVERYPTVWQMTSTVTGQTHADVPEIFAALFPSASVTGAPKIETMKIIRALEPEPRGVYCGAIGWWAPGRQARFSVAIRTATLDTDTRIARYPAGSGITWDSEPEREYEECAQKTAVLGFIRPEFSLLAALRYEDAGYFLLDMHLDRLLASAEYFSIPADRARLQAALRDYAAAIHDAPAKVRLVLDRHGALRITHETLPPPRPWNGGLALVPIDSHQPWTAHKTTHRDVYRSARDTRPDCETVFLWNQDGYLTETDTANIVLRFGDQHCTPPLAEGLLPGVYRRCLLEEGSIEEKRLTIDDLRTADAIFAVNSVRRWIPITWIPHPEAPESLQDIRKHTKQFV